MTRFLAALPLLALLAGCANPPPISANPVQSAVNQVSAVAPGPVQTVETGLLNAEWNLDQAIAIGALPANDPADVCMHQALTQIGIEPAPAGTATPPIKSFVPRETDLISTGAVIYIQIQQAKKIAGGGSITVPVSCKAVIGQFVLDAGALGIKLLPGGAILPVVN